MAVFRLTIDEDAEQARALLEQAVDQNPKDAASWLELELLAAADGDEETQGRALDARSQLVQNPTWQGVLLIELAEIVARQGDFGRAPTCSIPWSRSRAVLAICRVWRSSGSLAKPRTASCRPTLWRGRPSSSHSRWKTRVSADRNGVPRTMCTPARAAEAWLRAGELRRRSGDAWGAVAALTAASERLEDNAVIARLSMAAADAAGDAKAAVKIAQEQLEAGSPDPPPARCGFGSVRQRKKRVISNALSSPSGTP